MPDCSARMSHTCRGRNKQFLFVLDQPQPANHPVRSEKRRQRSKEGFTMPGLQVAGLTRVDDKILTPLRSPGSQQFTRISIIRRLFDHRG